MPHHCKKVSTLPDQIAALKASFRKNGGRPSQSQRVLRLRCPTMGREQLQAGVVSVASTAGPGLLPWTRETAQERKSNDDAESTIDDGQSVLSLDSRATLLKSSVDLKPTHAAPHYIWTKAGIDSLKSQEMWDAYDNPQAGHELAMHHLQLLRDTCKLGDMMKAKFFREVDDEVVEEACECDIDDPLSMLVGMGAEETYKVTLFSEVLVADALAACPSPLVVTTSGPAVGAGFGNRGARYLWTKAGIDSLRKQGQWKNYGSPVVGHELELSHFQALQGIGKLTAMVRAKYFVDTEECCDDWEPPCMTCPKCDVWRGATSLS